MKNTLYFRRANLLLELMPHIRREEEFGLKGGTAINFFYRNLPRLSVDVDLTYLPILDRTESLQNISSALLRIEQHISKIPGLRVFPKKLNQHTIALRINKDSLTIKIEPNLVLRGTVFPPQMLSLADRAFKLFERQLTVNCLSVADLYGGKICAALDRQHPRDLFDIKILLNFEGISEDIRKAFIVYLISHSRPMVELLSPNFIDISNIFENEFKGMTIEPTSLTELLETREGLVKYIKTNLSEKERWFILSIKETKPQWDLLGIKHIKDLPAVQWKLKNLEKMDKKKHEQAVAKLKSYLEL